MARLADEGHEVAAVTVDVGGLDAAARAAIEARAFSLGAASFRLVEARRALFDEVLRFLGRVAEPADHAPVDSAFRTILFTDLEGSTSLMQEVGERAFMGLLAWLTAFVERRPPVWEA